MTGKNKSHKSAPVLVQLGIYAGILWISSIISSFFSRDFAVPTPVIGLVLLYLLLTFKIIKLEWVEDFGMFLISIVGFLFVPSGIQIADDLSILKTEGLQVIFVILVATIALLVVTAYVTRVIITIHQKITGGNDHDDVN
ncbi:CidA/LrgA family protein [Lactobacillus acetotolerans]|uniref:CidA/LrgA family protein n=1 Tax=Lactobacillus acetotolerans TaxID=1600 RepID=UPI0007B8D147|nr:CidA/LrgA family protein [Lactobacillus acetotolerans]QGV04224.1 murein hydrolase regulator LrgA [Lactobacillus acetotolerans]